ncbi:hypothetical protein [Streptomyces diacarni]|uniref:hypothetical protein n=1 Tax=Streptomyces diacarni TaxID=2800381 RepID=UPI0015F02720|nr:hypothetical protein [Streptomyces diacarni]
MPVRVRHGGADSPIGSRDIAFSGIGIGIGAAQAGYDSGTYASWTACQSSGKNA